MGVIIFFGIRNMSGVSQVSSKPISHLVLITHSGLFCGSLWGASGLAVLGAVCNSVLGSILECRETLAGCPLIFVG